MTIIRIKPSSIIIELTEGRQMPVMARMQSSVVIEADRVGSDDDGWVYQFIYNDRLWTVGSEDTEEVTS